MNRRNFLSLAAGAALSGSAPAAPPQSMPVRVALVLGGGGCRGYGHIGVIRVLEKNGLKPDLVVGSSASSLVGALSRNGCRRDRALWAAA